MYFYTDFSFLISGAALPYRLYSGLSMIFDILFLSAYSSARWSVPNTPKVVCVNAFVLFMLEFQ